MMCKLVMIKQEPRKKQELRHLLANYNWYRMSVVSAEKQPYKMVQILRGLESPIEKLKDKRVYATSPSQARFLFLKLYPWLKHYYEDKKEVFGDVFEIEARMDADLLNSQKRSQELDRQNKEEQVQNAWWNQ